MSRTRFEHVKISGITCVVPEDFIRIDDELAFFNNDVKLLERNKKILGLGKRHVADERTTNSDLCEAAARELLSALNVDKDSIDALIVVSTSHDYHYPASACVIQGRLALSENCTCFDISGLACSAYVHGLLTAHSLISGGGAKKCLVLAGDITSRHSDRRNRNSNMLFGDAGTATLLEYTDELRPSFFITGTRGTCWNKLIAPAGGYSLPMFSDIAGLIKCGECGKSLTVRYTNAKHPQRIYSCKTYNAFGKNHCTQHRIDYDTLYSHVLRKIRECARAALMDGEAVADRLTNTCEAEQREQREAMERSLTRDEERIEVLDKMVMRLYEDMIAGRISEQNFNTMLEKTQTEQAELKAKVSEGRKRLSDEVQLANDAKQWVEAIQEYANITELDAATLNRLIKEIVVHERIDEDKTRHISIEIHFNLKPIPEVEQVTA